MNEEERIIDILENMGYEIKFHEKTEDFLLFKFGSVNDFNRLYEIEMMLNKSGYFCYISFGFLRVYKVVVKT
jgi:hypothetical protein